ncbi:hypothetical protein KM043_003913 [Ampulex compressa]|nr:hypothetical protein KM043_003913 [Ampulex compressa]
MSLITERNCTGKAPANYITLIRETDIAASDRIDFARKASCGFPEVSSPQNFDGHVPRCMQDQGPIEGSNVQARVAIEIPYRSKERASKRAPYQCSFPRHSASNGENNLKTPKTSRKFSPWLVARYSFKNPERLQQ